MSLVEEQVQTEARVASSSSLLDEIMAQARITPVDEGYQVAKQGMTALIANILESDCTTGLVNKALVDSMIVELDMKLSQQMDVILHAKALQEMESSWRSLKLLVDRTDFRENIRIQVLHATKEELLDDEIQALIDERQAARKAKNFARADEIRDELLAKGIILKDTREGVKWSRA